MQTWKAEAFGPVEQVLERVDAPDLAPPPADCVTVKVLAAAVGMPDVLMTKGEYPFVQTPPVSAGSEVVGIVTEVAEGVEFAVGDKVMGLTLFMGGSGGFSEYCYMSTKMLMTKVPTGMPDEQAAGFVVAYLTAHTGLVQRTKLLAGETLLVLGASGGTGSTAVQLGKALGATVVAVAGGPEKVAFCKSLGADHVVDYRAGSISEQVTDLVGTVDVIYDPVGGAAGEDALKSIGLGGRLALIGYGSGAWTKLDAGDMTARGYSAMGVLPLHSTAEELDVAYRQLSDLYQKGKISVPVDKIYEFDAVREAMIAVSKSQMLGKHIVRVSEA
nr:NADPH:quinone oxidoreductase family protein [Phaeobacter sp. J2-8]